MSQLTRDDLDREVSRIKELYEKLEAKNQRDHDKFTLALFGDGSDDNRGLVRRSDGFETFKKRTNSLIGWFGGLLAMVVGGLITARFLGQI